MIFEGVEIAVVSFVEFFHVVNAAEDGGMGAFEEGSVEKGDDRFGVKFKQHNY